ncbi:DUF7287 family protein [Halobaculum rubrum]|uniref:DUF7287 family protein n=1 Tax=Halobaculum rubrum TaxID=2872158 RepID=UPI001CA3D05C|nr:hypothetical protein [Halobaculum rubrum]QZX99606.1 hypothetical protein K6T25_00390 [Halobaculum rubrum]
MSDDGYPATDPAAGSGVERTRARDRGQTTIDYAVGVSVFLLVVAFVFAFAPSLTAPFTSDATDAVVVADRSADRIANDLLVADPARPSVLDADCTAGFFDTDEAVDTDCRYETDASDLRGALGIVSPDRTANVTVVSDGGIRVLGDGADAVPLAAGPAPPRGAGVSTARRAVLLDGSDATVIVRVW